MKNTKSTTKPNDRPSAPAPCSPPADGKPLLAPPVATQPPAPETEPEPVVTSSEVAVHYKVTERTVANWRSRGIITPVTSVGRVVRFRLSEVKQALANFKSNQN